MASVPTVSKLLVVWHIRTGANKGKNRKRLDLENAWGVLRYGVLVCQDCKLVHISLESQRKQKVSHTRHT